MPTLFHPSRLRLLLFPIALAWGVAGCSRGPDASLSVSASSGLAAASPIAVGETDWPWWHGADKNGVAREAQPPLEWSEEKNVVWRTSVPGAGHGSPTICGDVIYLPTADGDRRVSVAALRRSTGESLWQTTIHEGKLMRKHGKNSHASATLACDGQRAFAAFIFEDALWVTAIDAAGKIVWQEKAGPFVSQHGYGSSPVLHGSYVIVAGDNDGPGYLTAFHRETGQIAWRTPRARATSYSTPTIATLAGKTQLVLPGVNMVASYDPETGAEIWRARGPSDVAANTVACGGDLIVASGGYPQKEVLCLRADGQGDVSENVLWRHSDTVSYVPSPLLHDGKLYLVSDDGRAACLDAESGKVHWNKRLGGSFSASPVLAAGCIFACSEDGTTHVFKASDEFESVAENSLPEPIFATPAFCGDRIFVRTESALYCLGK